jgi:hypothetical protein
LPPLEPYILVAAASFRTSTLSKSFGFNDLKTPASMGIPSITYKGSFPPLIELTPLIFTRAAVPGCPEPDAI